VGLWREQAGGTDPDDISSHAEGAPGPSQLGTGDVSAGGQRPAHPQTIDTQARGERRRESLIVAEHLAAARCALAAAGPAGTAHPLSFGADAEVLAAPFRNSTRSTADQSLHVSGALRTRIDRSIGHLLTPLKTVSACIAEIIVSRHRKILSFVQS
jgi:hypothetical protein